MSGQAISIIVSERREKLGGTLGVSLAMHAVLFVVLVGYTSLGSSFGGGWGKNWGSGSSTRIGAVASLPGVPLPAPMLLFRHFSHPQAWAERYARRFQVPGLPLRRGQAARWRSRLPPVLSCRP